MSQFEHGYKRTTNNSQTWTASAGQLTYVLSGATYDYTHKGFNVYVAGVKQPDDGTAYTKDSATQFTLLCATGDITAGTIVEAVWSEPFVPATAGHNATHYASGQDALDITQLSGYAANVGDKITANTNQIGILSGYINAAQKYGFVADYTGTPQYDGNDGTRITCTDNTAAFSAMLDDCIAKKNLFVYFPEGHYGIKTGNITKDLTGCSLTIIGQGYDKTIIDFVKEDTTNTAYVDETKANVIAKISNFTFMSFKDIQIKATTNYNNIGSQTDPNAVYYGAVWGFILDTFDTLLLERVKITQFNYRGISTKTTNGTTLSTMSRQVIAKDCFFTANKSSGLWCTQLQELHVIGGEFSYNGQFGQTGTGYGVTASGYVGKATAKNAWFHNNYRKGFDTHGCSNVELDNCRFEDNVLYHFAVECWSMISDINYGNVVVNNCVFSNGLSPDSYTWLQNAYNALTTVNDIIKRGWLWNIDDRKNDRTDQNLFQHIVFTDNKVLCHYNGGDYQANATNAMAYIYAPVADMRWEGNYFNLDKWVTNTNYSNSACPFNISGTTMHLNRNTIVVKSDCAFGTGKYGVLFTLQGTNGNQTLNMKNNVFTLNNCFIFGNTSSGDITDPSFLSGSMRNFQNNSFEWSTLPSSLSSDNKLLGQLTNSSYPYEFSNNTVKIGTAIFQLPNKNYTYSSQAFQFNPMNTVNANTPFLDIILDNVVTYFTFSLYLSTSNETLTVQSLGSSYTNTVIGTAPTKFSLSAISTFTDTDGRQKTRIRITTGNNTFGQGYMYGEFRSYGMYYSWGVEAIKALV